MANVKPNTPKTQRKKNRSAEALQVINHYAAGIDIGDKEHAVAVSPGIDDEPVRTFGTMTCDMRDIAAWLKECEVETVAMESTGVYWKPLFSHLIAEGFEVYLVNARNVKNVSGRKTDMSDAAWLQKLHGCGMLSSSYLPANEQEALRTLVRHRSSLVSDSSRFANRMQKSLELMNIKIHTVISDINGRTGTDIVEAILAGERKPEAFLQFVRKGIKATHETILKSLEGTWKSEHLFTLKQNYEMYCLYKKKVEDCDKELEQQLRRYEALRNDGEILTGPKDTVKRKFEKANHKDSPKFNVRGYLNRILKVDPLNIFGVSTSVGLTLVAELGTDMSKWATEKQFVSWLNVCPNTKISGGRELSSSLRKGNPSPAGQAFRQAANSVQRSDNWLGDYFRRMKAKGGNKYAIVTTARKIATIYYKMVKGEVEFMPLSMDKYHEGRKNLKIKYLEQKLNKLKGGGL